MNKNHLINKPTRILLVVCLGLTVMLKPPIGVRAASVFYSAAAAQGNGDCSAWEHVCTLQTALTAAVADDEIWVQAGVHFPSAGSGRAVTFQLKNGVAIYGGFDGTEISRDDRDPAANQTVLSGDIGTPDDNSDNAYHVVTASGTNATAILDGFTLTKGNANAAFPHSAGGGIYTSGGSPTLRNLTFSGNSATSYGGAVFNSTGSSPTLTNVAFNNNTAAEGGGMYNFNSTPTLMDAVFDDNSGTNGGGMFNFTSSPTLTDVTFSNNEVTSYGGGLFNTQSSPELSDVRFNNNSAAVYGGGLYNFSNSNPTLTDVSFRDNSAGYGGGLVNYNSSPALADITFRDNSATFYGGGMYSYSSNPTLTNVTFYNNSAAYGGGMFNDFSSSTLSYVTISGNSATTSGGGMFNGNGNPTIRKTILWGNIATGIGIPQMHNNNAAPGISDSVVQDGCPDGGVCTNLITADPLLGALGDYGSLTDTLPLLPGSSAIDAGSNAQCPEFDQRNVSRPRGAGCDIGAYEARLFTLAITRGDDQTTPVNSAFPTSLGVRVTGVSNDPVNGGVVRFNAPDFGASSVPISATLTISSRAVSLDLTANGVVGDYDVIADTAGAEAPAVFDLSNQYHAIYLPLTVR